MSKSSDRQDATTKVIDVEEKIEEAEPLEMPAPTIQTKTKKVAILGTTPSRMEAPIGDTDWEIWTIGPGGKDVHRWDRLFEIHNRWPVEFGELAEDKSYLDDLSKVAPPQAVYTLSPMQLATERWASEHEKDEAWVKENVRGDWSGNVVINTDALYERHGKMWFSSSISYAMALAIEEGYNLIAIFGIDLESGEEYVSQYPGCRHFIDLARFIGIDIVMPHGCGLMREPLPYPDRYETHQALMLERKVAWLEAMLGEQMPQYEEARMMTSRVEGALLKMRQMREQVASGQLPTLEQMEADLKTGEAELVQYSRQEHQMQANINHLRGEMSALHFAQRMWVFGIIDPNYDLTVRPPR